MQGRRGELEHIQERETREKREKLSTNIWEVIQLRIFKGCLDHLRSSSNSQSNIQNHLTTIVNHHLPTKLSLGPSIVDYTQNITQINWDSRPNDFYIILGRTTTSTFSNRLQKNFICLKAIINFLLGIFFFSFLSFRFFFFFFG